MDSRRGLYRLRAEYESRYNEFVITNPQCSELVKIRSALRELQEELEKLYGEDHPTVLVYGSHARGEAGAESDIDVLLLYRSGVQPGVEIRRLSSILADLNMHYSVLISILPTTEKEYREASGPFWRNLRSEGLPVGTV